MVNFLKNSEIITDEENDGVPRNIDLNNSGVFANNIMSDEIELRDKNTTTISGELNKAFVIESDDVESQKLKQKDSGAAPVKRKSINFKYKKSNICAFIKRRINILTWITTYDKNMALGDLIAGITLGLTIIPQAIAYAALANLPSQYGLYSAFMGSLVYVIFGTIKEVSIGPTSLMALLTLQYTIDKPKEFAVILAFLAGCVELLMGILRLGFLVDFISVPVTSAFTTATSLIIIGSQLKNLLGLKYSSKGFADSIYELILRLGNSQLGDGVLGLLCCAFLLSLRQINLIKFNTETKSGQTWKKIIWYISISRNAIIVFITSCVAYNWLTTPPFKLSGKVEPGIPYFQLPPFEIEYNNETLSFFGICTELGTGIAVVPLVAVLANVAIAKSFSSGTVVDATQEMLTLGLCNILGSCFKSMPTCGAFTRSAVSSASGVKTPMAGIYTGIITILALSLLTPYFYYIPSATLGSVLIIAVVFMIDFKLPITLWSKNRRDFIAWLCSFIVCLAFGVELGLLFGIIINVLHLLFMWARPETTIKIHEIENMQYIRVTPNAGMFFPGIDNLRERANKASSAAEYQVPVVIDCVRFIGLDYTAAQGITNLSNDLYKKKQVLILQYLDPKLQTYIANNENILFCNKEESLKEMLTQEAIRNGTINLMDHIRASIDFGYKVDPLINVNEIKENE